MTTRDIPDSDHVVRHVRSSLVAHDRVDGSAFLRRAGEEAVSVNWLEFFPGDHASQLSRVRGVIQLELRRNARFATLNVGEAKQAVEQAAHDVGFGIGVHSDPRPATATLPADPSHAVISGLPSWDSSEALFVGDLLARCVICPLDPAKAD